MGETAGAPSLIRNRHLRDYRNARWLVDSVANGTNEKLCNQASQVYAELDSKSNLTASGAGRSRHHIV
jgi:hypothetical protein